MSLYQIHHTDHILTPPMKENIALGLTQLHSDLTGCPRSAIKIFFCELDLWSFWSGGQKAQKYVRVEAQMKKTCTSEDKFAVLKGAYDIVAKVIEERKDGKGLGVEVQTQIIEVDVSESVMTDGVFDVEG